MNPIDPSATPPLPAVSEPDDFKAMTIGAAVIFAIAFIPYSFVTFCLPSILGALLAVHLFTKAYGLTLSPGKGIKLGILTAMLGGISAWAVMVAIQLLTGYQYGFEQVEALMLKVYSHMMNPDALEKVKQAFEAQKAQGLTLWKLVFGFFGTIVGASISGLIGGALGAALFKRGPAREELLR